MRVIFISASRRKSRETVSLILDLYADRIGPDTWTANVTEKGLETIRMSLEARSVKGLSVLCRRISGFSRKHTPVQWIVGQKHRFHTETGLFSVQYQSVLKGIRSAVDQPKLSRLRQLARMAGSCHDLGKNNAAFQALLVPGVGPRGTADPVRHEILSTFLMVPEQSGNLAAADAWFRARREDHLKLDLNSTQGLVKWAVASHHRLPGKQFSLTENKHIRPELEPLPGEDQAVDAGPFPAWDLPPDEVLDQRILGHLPASAFYLRWSLMMADHFVSGLDPAEPAKNSALTARALRFLNQPTGPNERSMANSRQKLRPHLDAITDASGWMFRYLSRDYLRKTLPEIDQGFALEQAGKEGRYAWQHRSVQDALTAQPSPSLCLVTSATGSGKTRACLAIADALCQRRGEGLRATVALGLRTLTLQTGDAYRETFGLGPDQLSVLIGSRAASDLHSASANYRSEADEEEAYQTDMDDFWQKVDDAKPRLAPWIGSEFSRGKDAGYLLTPILVSTIDQVIQAADLSRSKWTKPMLRLMSGPLIIDEVDSYDPADMIPILRLVYFTGMLGQDVICSSATIYPAVANVLIQSHRAGAEQYHRLLGKTGPCQQTGFFSDAPVGQFQWFTDETKAIAGYQTFCQEAQRVSPLDKRRPFEVLPKYDSEAQALQDLGHQALKLHNSHSWEENQGRLSVGMVRFAHVRDVVAACKALSAFSDETADLVLVPYHSRNFLLSRAFIEARLDQMLHRSDDPAAPLRDPDVARRLRQAHSQGKSLCVVVVCSPVEEVGRDHDFDWAIVEPSSTRSLVQVAGRVLRHRPEALPTVPNTLIYRHPLRAFRPYYLNRPIYANPGFETSDSSLNNRIHFRKFQHDISQLLACSESPDSVITADWCTQPVRPLPKLEDTSIREYLDKTFLRDWLGDPTASMQSWHFHRHGFRKQDGTPTQSYFVELGHNGPRLRSQQKGAALRENIRFEAILDPNSLLFSSDWYGVLDYWRDRLPGENTGAFLEKFMQIDLRTKDQSVDLVYGVIA